MAHRSTRSRGFTLIEVLVVVAIIALLISILLPSLSAAKEQARMTACQSHMKSMATSFVVWSSEHKGRLPGVRSQSVTGLGPVNWLGPYNEGAIVIQPRKGAIFRHMGGMAKAYLCPSDELERYAADGTKYQATHSYTFHSLLAGASTEWLAGAHRLKESPYDSGDHTGAGTPLTAFEHVPMIVEEDFVYSKQPVAEASDGSWSNIDGLADRHLGKDSKGGMANIGYVDTHVGRVQLPHGSAKYPNGDQKVFFQAKQLCIRTTGGKWISGKSWDEIKGSGDYGKLLALSNASNKGITHPGDD